MAFAIFWLGACLFSWWMMVRTIKRGRYGIYEYIYLSKETRPVLFWLHTTVNAIALLFFTYVGCALTWSIATQGWGR